MSTKANYEFKNDYETETVYIHHDGYEMGAAYYFFNAIMSLKNNQNKLDVNNFFRANIGAEFSKTLHPDIEFLYNYDENTEILKVYKIWEHATKKELIYTGNVFEFVNKYLNTDFIKLDDIKEYVTFYDFESTSRIKKKLQNLVKFHKLNGKYRSILTCLRDLKNANKELKYFINYDLENPNVKNALDNYQIIIENIKTLKALNK